VRFGEADVLDGRWGPSLYFTHDPGQHAFLGSPTILVLEAILCKIDPVPTANYMMDKIGPALLSVGEQIQSSLLLVVKGDDGSIIL
jgi:hypothetical protein